MEWFKRVFKLVGSDPAYLVKLMLDRILSRRTKPIYSYRKYLVGVESKKHRGTVHKKRALVSYSVSAFRYFPSKRNKIVYSNLGIAQDIPRALNELGYTVDIVSFQDVDFLPKQSYDLFFSVIGAHNFEQIIKRLPPETPKISFAGTLYWRSWNSWEEDRFRALFQRRGVNLPLDRFLEGRHEEYACQHSDGIICHGNEFHRETYKHFPLVLNLNNAAFPVNYDIDKSKDYEAGRNGFVFFNGPGNVHKGLDLLLEAFPKLEQHLYICQPIEPEFAKVYKRELYDCANIHVQGSIKMRSNKFYELINKCNFVISPTCAEGQPGSVIECMAHGLIPIISREACIDVKNFGVIFKENTSEEISNVVKELSQKSTEWCREKSRLVLKEVAENYTEEKFIQGMKNTIQTIIQKKEETLGIK